MGYTYDEANRVISTTLPDGRTYRFSYDANDNCTAVTMPSGAVHQQEYT